jgi:hypothetical protein
MPIKKQIIVETSQAETAPSVLALLTTSSDKVKRYLHERKLERYRQRIAESGLALTRHRDQHSDMERQLLEEEAKDQIEPPHA